MNWQDIYLRLRLDPKEPLSPGGDRLAPELYINDFFNEVKDKLQLEGDRNYKLLLSGHTGCGKSTFLKLLAADPEIQSHFHVVNYSIGDLLDVNDIDHIDLLLSIAVQALTSLPEDMFEQAEELGKKAEALAKQLQGLMVQEGEIDTSHKDEAGAGVETGFGFLDFLKSKLFLRYRFEQQRRSKVREHYRVRITDLLSVIDSLFLEIQTRLGKHLLILIDDTDKMPPEKGLDVFYDNGHHLAAPKTNIVYVIDIALSTHTRYAAIQGKFSGSEFFPAIKVVERDGETPAAGRNVLLELAKKRLSEEGSYDEAALKSAIEYSGGVVRELIRILQYAVFNAKGTVRTSNIDAACHRIANGFNLFGKHNFILRWVLEDPDWLAKAKDEENETILLDLLHMPALFQYRNGEIKWYRPYPVLIDWLKRLYPKPPESLRQGHER